MPGFVYVIGASEAGPVKIGRANNPRARLTELQCAHHVRLHLFHNAECDYPPAVEAKAHAMLSEHRLVGEWFNITTAVAIEAVDNVLLAEGARAEAALAEKQRDKDELYVRAMSLHEEREEAVPSHVELLSDAALKMADAVGAQRLRERTERVISKWRVMASQRSFFLWPDNSGEQGATERTLVWDACGLMLSGMSRYWKRRGKPPRPREAPLLDA